MKWVHPHRYRFRVSERARQGLKRGLGARECERRKGHAWAKSLVCLRCGEPNPQMLVFDPLEAKPGAANEQVPK